MIRVLGRLTVERDDGRELDLPSRRARALPLLLPAPTPAPAR